MNTPSKPAPNTQVRDGKIYRFERVDIAEAHGILSQSDRPLCGFRDADFQPWHMAHLRYVHPGASEPYRTHHGKESYQQCARIYVEAIPLPTDTQLIDKLAESELKHADGRQEWSVFTDRSDPQMTVREALAAWGGDE